ncbi:spondin domain-containing protein [Paraglaciecola sp. 2405UD69-4]|uniref:spondin domain-containing protein n=1 Tax=Paraglaciecola sp. 2405UD69-4 TaxID=3391836 RepID=UPI0039C958E8
MKLTKLASAAFLAFAASGVANAVELDITITNLTHAQSFTPRLVVAHTAEVDTFELGTEASTALAWLAEAGVIDDEQNADSSGQNFEAMLGAADVDNGTNTWHRFGGLVAPSTSVSYPFETLDYPYLSLLSMLVPTNDAFLGLDSIEIPTEAGTYTYTIHAYDAGTELNDELNSTRTDVVEAGTGNALGGYGLPGVAGVGASPVEVGTGGTGVAVQIVAGEVEDGTDGPVHIHRGILGDTSTTAGASDLDSTAHRWLNPVARVTIVVPAS